MEKNRSFLELWGEMVAERRNLNIKLNTSYMTIVIESISEAWGLNSDV